MELNPTNVDILYNTASALHELNALEDAERFYNRVISVKPDHLMAHYNLGYLYQDKGNMTASIECFRRAIQIDRYDTDSYINLGTALKHQGRLQEALQAYQRAIQIDGKCIMAHFNLGNSFQDMLNFDSAIQSFLVVLDLDADHIDALFNLAVAYQERAYASFDPVTKSFVREPKAFAFAADNCDHEQDLLRSLECYQRICESSYSTVEMRDEARAASTQIQAIFKHLASSP